VTVPWAMKPKSPAQMMEANISVKLEPDTVKMIPQNTARQLLMVSLSGSHQEATVLHRQNG